MGYSARRGFTNGSQNPAGSRRQAALQQKIVQMQAEMTAAQEEVEAQEFSATSGGGAVEAVANGKRELVSLNIKPEAVDPQDTEMLQDLVVTAVNEALRQAQEAMDKRMESASGNLNLGGFNLNLGSLGL
ncbi:MAG: YbaB/EbfC family nucleoid-associated protein [Oscillibacter sp.]|nr:YbaB/EbfC family nucleoid-associated protein [Oscillibacter sp.]